MRIAIATFVLSIFLLPTSSASATTINLPEGVDLFVVLPGSSVNFAGPYALPADFFGPGSDPFTGVVDVQGVPLEPDPICQGGSPLPGEIIIRRDPIVLPDPPAVQEIEIEIVQMKLVSVSPITVTFNGGQNPELWNVEIVPILPQPPVVPPCKRQIELLRDSELGGDFTTTYAYDSLYRLIRETNPGPPLEMTPPVDEFGGQGRWGIPAIPFPAPPAFASTPGELACPACKTDDLYVGFDGVEPQSFWLTGQFFNLHVVIACTGTVPVESTTWGALKNAYR